MRLIHLNIITPVVKTKDQKMKFTVKSIVKPAGKLPLRYIWDAQEAQAAIKLVINPHLKPTFQAGVSE